MSDTIKEFLVSLGFKIDSSSEAKFTRSIAAASLQAKLLGDAFEAAARSIHDGVAAMAADLDKLFFASQRTKASAENIKALQYAFSQVGGSADGAMSAIEGIARFLRNNPAGESFIKGLGVQTRDANGALRDTGDLAKDLGKRFRDMPNYMANAYGGIFGMDERSVLALQQNFGEAEAAYHRFVAAAHVDMAKVTADSNKFMTAERQAGAAIGVLFDKVAGQLAGPFAAQVDRATNFLVAHYDQISRGIEAVVKGIAWMASTATTVFLRVAEVVGDVVDWFDRLDVGTQRLIEGAGALLVAWRVLSRGFLATPLGALTSALTGLLLLMDDYAGWRSGKRSLIDWSGMDAGIQGTLKTFESVGGWVNDLVQATIGWKNVLEDIAILMAGSWLKRVVGALTATKVAAAEAAAATAGVGGGKPGVGGKADAAGKLVAAYAGWELADQASDATRPKQAGLANLAHNMAFELDPRHWTQSYGIEGTASAAGMPSAGGGAGHVMAFMQSLGWGAAQAAGLAASVMRESKGDPSAVGDHGQAYGALQWHPDRQANFARWAGHDIHGSSLDEQLQFMDYELRRGAERAAGAALMAAHSARESGMVVSERFVRPGDRVGEANARGNLADNYFHTPPLGASYARGDTNSTTTNAPVINSNTTVHVNGAADPQATGRAVADQQSRVTQNAARQFRSVVS